jgi:hypothetical protein
MFHKLKSLNVPSYFPHRRELIAMGYPSDIVGIIEEYIPMDDLEEIQTVIYRTPVSFYTFSMDTEKYLCKCISNKRVENDVFSLNLSSTEITHISCNSHTIQLHEHYLYIARFCIVIQIDTFHFINERFAWNQLFNNVHRKV